MTSLKAVPRIKLEAQLETLTKMQIDLDAEVISIRSEMAERLKKPLAQLAELKGSIESISTELNNRRERDALVPTISDHALLRYIERVHGIDINHIRSLLLTPNVVEAIKNGAKAIKVDGYTMQVNNMTVTTVTVQPPKPKKPSRARMEAMEHDDEA